MKPGNLIPDIVDKCIKEIDSKCKKFPKIFFLRKSPLDLEVVGIFRLSGSQLAIDQYKKAFDSGFLYFSIIYKIISRRKSWSL